MPDRINVSEQFFEAALKRIIQYSDNAIENIRVFNKNPEYTRIKVPKEIIKKKAAKTLITQKTDGNDCIILEIPKMIFQSNDSDEIDLEKLSNLGFWDNIKHPDKRVLVLNDNESEAAIN